MKTKMEFLSFTLPKDVFPRFENASTKCLELQSRYNAMLCQSKKTNFKEIKSVILHLCKKGDEMDFSVKIDSCIVETMKIQNLDQGRRTKSRNIKSFLQSQEENDSVISVLVADIKGKREIEKLGPTKTHFVLITEDSPSKADFVEEFVRHDGPIITVANKETISREIDNLLERISLAPLKAVAENCYEKFQQTETSAGFPNVKSSNMTQTGSKSKAETLENRNGMTDSENCTNKRSGLPSDFLRPSSKHGHITTEKTASSIPMHQQYCNLTVVTSNINKPLGKRLGKAKMCGAQTENISAHVSTIYTRSKRNGERVNLLNGLKDKIHNTISSESKETKRPIRQRSVETQRAVTQRDKRRKKDRDCSDHIDISDIEYQSSSVHNTKEEENPERLLEAILAVYGMSNVPEAERPKVPKQSCKVSKEMRNELFKICPTVKRMGYRYRTFYIYAVKPKNETDEASRRDKICSVLKRYGIHNFKIAPCAENVTELIHVGAEIEVRPAPAYSLRSGRRCGSETLKGGTLGCFVNMNDGEGQCGLLSKHVTQDCSDVYFVGKGNKRKIGQMLEDTNRHQDRGLDISAALISEHIDENGTKFKDRRQTLLKGVLHEYNEDGEDAICRCGQPVHIFGAKSNPGKGEITMPYVECGLSTALIQVEDQISDSGSVKEHFAESGDSGAIVCVEDPEGKKVHALSMVMGTDLKETARRKYLTIPLSKGLQQLEENTGKTFTLC